MRASTPKAVSEPKTPGTGPAFRLPFDNSFFQDMQGSMCLGSPEPSRPWPGCSSTTPWRWSWAGAGDAEVCDRSGVAVRRGNAG